MDTCQRCGAPGRVEVTHPIHHLDATYCLHCWHEVELERTAARWLVRHPLPPVTAEPATH